MLENSVNLFKVLVQLNGREFVWRKNIEIEEGREEKRTSLYRTMSKKVFGEEAEVYLCPCEDTRELLDIDDMLIETDAERHMGI